MAKYFTGIENKNIIAASLKEGKHGLTAVKCIMREPNSGGNGRKAILQSQTNKQMNLKEQTKS